MRRHGEANGAPGLRRWRAIAGEALVVLGAGALVGLGANALSPRGLELGRDYFPVVAAPPGGRPVAGDDVAARLRRRGWQAAGAEEVAGWFRDAAQTATVFIDARDEARYRAGHVPGAWPFNHYRPAEFLPVVLPVCLGALRVVVYCGGGACEDSEFAAVLLRDAGVPAAALVIFPGGFAEWQQRGLPVETGARGGAGAAR